DRIGLFLKVAQECGEVGSFRLGPLPILLINSPKMLNSILVEQSAIFSSEPFAKSFTPVLGRTALPATHGEQHRKIRRIMAPAFQPRRLAAYCDQMVALSDEAQREVPDNAEVDMIGVTSRLTRDILAHCLFRMDFREEESFFSALRTVAQFVAENTADPLQLPLSVPTSRNRRVNEAIALMRNRAHRLIETCRERGDKGDVLSMMLLARDEDGTALTEEELLDQALTLYLAGQETSANGLSWLWLVLARNPEVQARLHAELDEVLQGRLPTQADLPRLPYALQVLKESMRVLPPIHLFARTPLQDAEVDGYLFRKGQFIIISPYTLHRHPEYFPDPERVDPERFSPQNEKKLPRGAYMPFGFGPHVCIGQHFAMLEMQLVMIRLCQNLSFSLMSDRPVRPLNASTLAPEPFTLKVHRRKAPLALAS
ncbi:MAG: cytochrome P450, partial [Cystobacter sp.]